jgi:outer membrane receptor for Fe3+-dicitrate
VNFSAGRVRPNFSLDLSAGMDVWKHEKSVLRLEGEIENLTDRLNVINFAGLFSGTAIAPPRSGSVRLQYQF